MNNIFYHFRKASLLIMLLAGTAIANAQCTTPAALTAIARTCDSIGITWTAVPGVINYIYAVSISATPPSAGTVATTNSVEVGNLNQGTLYYVHVRANCMGSVSTWATTSLTTCGTYCPVPTNVTATVSNNSSTATWNAVAGVLGYEYKLDQTFANPTSGTFTTATTATVSGLTGGTNYYWHVRSKCSPTTFSAWRVGYSVTTTGFDPGCVPPASVSVMIRRCDSVGMSWAAVPGATAYDAGISQFLTTPPSSLIYTANTTTELAQPLAASTHYAMYVRNNCGTSIGQWRTDTFTTPACPVGGSCPPVAAVNVNIVSCDSVKLSWTYVPGAGVARSYSYTVTTSSTPPATGIQAGNHINAGIGGLLPSTQYYAHVRTNCRGTNAWATQAFMTPSCGGGVTCLAPATVTNNSITQNTANISWTAAANAIGYEYVLNQTATDPTANGTLVTGLTTTVSALTPNTTYYWHLRTKCGATSYSPWKAATQVITPGNTAVGTVSASDIFMTVYPNPATNIITMSFNQQPGKNARIVILGIDGRTVKALRPSLNAELDIHELKSGIYFIKYSDQAKNQVIRFTKE